MSLISERARCAQVVADIKKAELNEEQEDTIPIYYRPEREAQVLRTIMQA